MATHKFIHVIVLSSLYFFMVEAKTVKTTKHFLLKRAVYTLRLCTTHARTRASAHTHTPIMYVNCPIRVTRPSKSGRQRTPSADYHTTIAYLIYWQWSWCSHTEIRGLIVNPALINKCTSVIVARPNGTIFILSVRYVFSEGLTRATIRQYTGLNTHDPVPWLSALTSYSSCGLGVPMKWYW